VLEYFPSHRKDWAREMKQEQQIVSLACLLATALEYLLTHR
jgi:hypothetical protein